MNLYFLHCMLFVISFSQFRICCYFKRYGSFRLTKKDRVCFILAFILLCDRYIQADQSKQQHFLQGQSKFQKYTVKAPVSGHSGSRKGVRNWSWPRLGEMALVIGELKWGLVKAAVISAVHL